MGRRRSVVCRPSGGVPKRTEVPQPLARLSRAAQRSPSTPAQHAKLTLPRSFLGSSLSLFLPSPPSASVVDLAARAMRLLSSSPPPIASSSSPAPTPAYAPADPQASTSTAAKVSVDVPPVEDLLEDADEDEQGEEPQGSGVGKHTVSSLVPWVQLKVVRRRPMETVSLRWAGWGRS